MCTQQAHRHMSFSSSVVCVPPLWSPWPLLCPSLALTPVSLFYAVLTPLRASSNSHCRCLLCSSPCSVWSSPFIFCCNSATTLKARSALSSVSAAGSHHMAHTARAELLGGGCHPCWDKYRGCPFAGKTPPFSAAADVRLQLTRGKSKGTPRHGFWSRIRFWEGRERQETNPMGQGAPGTTHGTRAPRSTWRPQPLPGCLPVGSALQIFR